MSVDIGSGESLVQLNINDGTFHFLLQRKIPFHHNGDTFFQLSFELVFRSISQGNISPLKSLEFQTLKYLDKLLSRGTEVMAAVNCTSKAQKV